MISLCILAKNEGHCIHMPISCLRSIASEIVLMDDHSSDKTVRIASALGAQIFKTSRPVSETGFAVAANEMISCATMEWILIIDADEIIDQPAKLFDLTRFQDVDAWSLPRRKWARYPDERMEYESYPDWQPKFFRNIDDNRFEGEMHVRFTGATPRRAYRGPHIEHLQLDYRTPAKIKQRVNLYEKFAKIQGVKIHGGDLVSLDSEER